jgi:hypothetical protein
MGKRSRRQRQPAPVVAEPSSAKNPRKAKLRERAAVASEQAERAIKQRPPAPWDPFPLMELAVFVGLVLLVIGIILQVTGSGPVGNGLMASGVVLACIGGLDTAIREHFNGYRSHAGLLAGLMALATLLLCGALLPVSRAIDAGIAIGVFAIGFPALRRGFIRRSGGKGVL